jgi:hypothetical protein
MIPHKYQLNQQKRTLFCSKKSIVRRAANTMDLLSFKIEKEADSKGTKFPFIKILLINNFK